MKITVIGGGYVGLVVSICFSKFANEITVVDLSEDRIKSLRSGKLPIYEPGLEQMLQQAIDKGVINFTTDLEKGLKNPDYIFIAVGTPSLENGEADVSSVLAVSEKIGDCLDTNAVVVQKSTVPVGTADKLESVISHRLLLRKKRIKVDVVSNPEFLREGLAVSDFLNPDRVVIGCQSEGAAEKMRALYKPLISDGELIITDRASAEIAKYACNAMLATKISFMNELSLLCEGYDADILDVKQVMSSDHRIGPHFITPGPGYGGSCFPKDVKALAASFERSGLTPTLVNACEAVNEAQKHRVFAKLDRYYGNQLSKKTVAIWGLAFKPDTDDVRESPAIPLIERLIGIDAAIQAYDPKANASMEACLDTLTQLTYANSKEEALEGADVLVILTDWPEFSDVLPSLFTKLSDRLVFDTRNIFAGKMMEDIRVIGTGRQQSLIVEEELCD